MKTIFLLNQDFYFYPEALDRILSKTKYKVEKIFVFPAFVDSKKKAEYEKASIQIMGLKFCLKFVIRSEFQKILSVMPVPFGLKSRSSLRKEFFGRTVRPNFSLVPRRPTVRLAPGTVAMVRATSPLP